MSLKSIKHSFKRGLQHKPKSPASDYPVSPPPTPANATNNNKDTTNGQTPPSSTSSTATPDGNQDSVLSGVGMYKFTGQLGSGKFSKVMLAKHIETGKQVAVKIIDKQAHDYRVMSRLVREVTLMEVLDHPNIVKMIETYETCDTLFLMMEYVPGQNLDEYLHERGTSLSEDEARRIFRQLVSAVYFCHSRWVVHRDLKTPNILITPEGVVKLADFGLGNRYGLQRLKTICGSMLYYSPEIITGQKYFGPEVDCWCLGIALFRMTAGFEPFSHAHTVGELKKDVCSCNYPMPGTLSADLQTTIRKCLQTDRRKRMTLRQALKDDPWLTNHGELPCPFASVPKTAYDEVVGEEKEEEHVCRADRERRARRQFMKDLERDKNRESTVKRTVIYHPVNASTYFTPRPANQNNNGTTQHNPNQRHYPNIEVLRSELLQSIRMRSKRLGMRTADRWDLRSPVQSLTLRFKKKSAGVTNSQDSLHTSSASLTPTATSNTNNAPPSPTPSPSPSPSNTEKSLFSEVMHRWTNKDQVYHFHIGKSSLSRPPSLSSSLSTSTSSLSSTAAEHTASTPRPTRQQQQQQQQQQQHQCHPTEHQQLSITRRHERDVMQLLKQTCQLMGITYVQDSPRRLLCVLTLRDGPKGAESSNVNNGGASTGGPPSSNKMRRRTSRNSSQTTAISSNNDDPTLVLGTSGAGESAHQRLRRLSLPLFSQLTSSMTTSFFGRTKQRHSVDEQRKKSNSSEGQQQQQQKEQQRNKRKDGLAVFAIDVEFHSKSNQQHSHDIVHMLVTLRFSKQQGSTTVFKMAGGWVAGVMGLSHP
ncbi:kinase-like domain-containing protein [Syncephalastrum racemosum]|uniref:Kinase-like domain-containing protein n=1 Tax=Syncephalastrum racemosum TaxID=13706 RepID=A0A1X2H0Y6_SYNRA|nr:kinase-like domain-containing protein [Syncephalastrum racemosum]